MLDVVTRPKARQDLKDIWLYSCKQWNEAQADEYLSALDTGIAKRRTNPSLGRPREDVRSGYRSLRIKAHIVYYQVVPPVIRIVRVLHARMDPGRYL
ncbi:type II toxin-antitoxin system RelE/ParE family toxin [uncultured Thiohalocapsa sp.]|uniref:type II toxin-antitoxin system RelE/ParE family toxin n=1 Tax=uncultured Thiohalocapsa sp. TaxID=768990 RepID=UPI0025EEA75E|nr:type II toxin-antitoxin system RelE/ParE family toxin [uncultured Thiohalocapsa sp.]